MSITSMKDIAEGRRPEILDCPLGKQAEHAKDLPSMRECDMPWDDLLNGGITEGTEGREVPRKPWNPTDIQPQTEGPRNPVDILSEIRETTSRMDDNGQIYVEGVKLLPDTTYELNGSVYKTDEYGNIISCESKPKLTPENPRDTEAQVQSGGKDRREGDQGGHIIGRDMGGDSGAGNLIPMDSRINQSDYKRMENDIKAALKEGKDVSVKTEISYKGDSQRPDIIQTTVQIDGKDTVYLFDNNLDGSLKKEVPENGKEVVQAKLDAVNGEISSVKKEYDEDGNLIQTEVCITYKDENGTNYRTKVVVENS